jgi:hypothetical protein
VKIIKFFQEFGGRGTDRGGIIGQRRGGRSTGYGDRAGHDVARLGSWGSKIKCVEGAWRPSRTRYEIVGRSVGKGGGEGSGLGKVR